MNPNGLGMFQEGPFGTGEPPKQGHRGVGPFVFEWTQNATYAFDLWSLQTTKWITRVVCVFIDNSVNSQTVTCAVNNGQQTILIQPNQQGYFPILCGGIFSFKFASTSTNSTRAIFLNYNPGGMTWGPSTFPGSIVVSGDVSVDNFPATQNVSGTVAVSSLPSIPAGANLIGHVDVDNFPATQPVSGSVAVSNFPATQPVSGSVAVTNFPATQPVSGTVAVSSLPSIPAGTNDIGQVEPQAIYSGPTLHPVLVGNQIKILALGATGTTPQTIVTGAPGFYICGIQVEIAPLSTVALAGQVSFAIADSNFGTIWTGIMWIPGAPAPNFYAEPTSFYINTPPGFFWNNKVANTSLTVVLSAVLATGNFVFTVVYGLCNFVN